MANPQPTDAHLRVAHSINEAIMMRDFSKRQRKILDLILRLSWGCNKKYAKIPRQKDFEIVGIGEGHIKVELIWLAQSRIITIDGDKFSFNKDFDQWQVSRVRPFTPDKLTELVSLNLNGHYPELTETVSPNLPKQEETTYQKGKLSTPELVLPKERLKKVLKKDIYIVPEWIDKDTWEAFLEMRKKKKAIPTERAKQLLVQELEKLRTEGHDPMEVLNQSIMRNYTGVFPVKGGQDGTHKQKPGKLPTHYRTPEEIYREIDAER